MQRLSSIEARTALAWLGHRPAHEAFTGYAPDGWAAQTWILHAMYENPSLRGLGTHDDLHRRRLDAGDVAPVIIGDVNLDDRTTVTGTPLGFVVRPGSTWQRVTWSDYLDRFRDFRPNRDFPPCSRWFPHGSWPVAIEPPPEGSMDEESLDALLRVLTDVSRADTQCFAFYASSATGDFDEPHVWRGLLEDVPSLVEEAGDGVKFTPSNLWAADHSWFIWTDADLQGTRVQGSAALVERVTDADILESVSWP